MSQSIRRSALRVDNAPTQSQLRLPPALRADCSKCSGLCCAVHAFYACQGFGFDKLPHVACRHLNPQQRCSIHRQRQVLGFTGCIAFDCHGAGQRVTQELFLGVSWRTSPQIASSMFAAYSVMLVLHRLLAQLSLVAPLASPAAGIQFTARREHLEQLCRSSAAADGLLNTAAIERETLQFLRSQTERA